MTPTEIHYASLGMAERADHDALAPNPKTKFDRVAFWLIIGLTLVGAIEAVALLILKQM